LAVTRNAYGILAGNQPFSANMNNREGNVGIILIWILGRHNVRLGEG
jgi:hypothetical protein